MSPMESATLAWSKALSALTAFDIELGQVPGAADQSDRVSQLVRELQTAVEREMAVAHRAVAAAP